MQRVLDLSLKRFDPERDINGWRSPFLFILKSLRLLGYLPFTQNHTGYLRFRLLSIAVVWSVCVTFLQIYLLVEIYIWRLTMVKKFRDFDKTIILVNILLLFTTSLHGVLGSWGSTPRIAKAVNRWITFQEQLSYASGRKHVSLFLDRAYIGLLIVCFGVVLMFVNKYMGYRGFSWYQVFFDFLYFVCLSYYVSFLWLWIVICAMVRTTAELLNHHLSKILSDSPTPDDILSVRRLWLELHGSTLDLVDGLASTLRLWKTTSFTLTLLTLYALLTVISKGLWKYIIIDIPALIISCVAGFVAFTASDSAQTKVTQDIVYTICSSKWSQLPENVQSQLWLLLDAVEMGSPCFEVQGMDMIDKVNYLSLTVGIISDLVVLMQFRVSTTN